jgi:hypothetical protein
VYRKEIRFLKERSTERERKRKDNAETRRARSFAEEENRKREARGRQDFNTEDTEAPGAKITEKTVKAF